MSRTVLKVIFVSALVLVIIGIVIAFIDLQIFCINIRNDGYVGAIFSLAGILLYFTALMYQIKEYQLQVKELRKSVQAQTKSSEALDEQKRIFLEQNTNSLIFGMIDSFNNFSERNKIQSWIDQLIDYYQSEFFQHWNNLKKLQLNPEELNQKFATDIKDIFTKTIIERENYPLIRKYVQFAYNILSLIDTNIKHLSKDNFTPFFLSQLNPNEAILLFLSNLADPVMPYYDNLSWSYYNTKEITDMILNYNLQRADFKELDNKILTTEFIKLKQNK